MDRETVLKALIDWNFWYKEQYTGIIRDEYVNSLLQMMDIGLAIDVTGVKRCGKSTIINQVVKKLINNGVDPFNTLIINFEDPRFNIRNGNDLFQLYEIYKEIKRKEGRTYIFLDEVQKVENWEGFVRSLIDRKEAYVIVSGSVKMNISESLSGRHLSFIVYPLSFKEFLEFKKLEIKNDLDILAKEPIIKSLFLEFVKLGGFPLVALSELKEKVLVNLYEDIISKDVIERCKIKNVHEVRTLSLFYLSQIGNRISFRKISRSLNIPIKNVLKYTECLTSSFLIYFVNPLNSKLSEMVKAEKKVYSIDQGLANVIGFRLNESLGSLLENVVFIELLRRYGINKIFYYRGKRGEVDFVIKDNEVKEAYQVTYSLQDMEREIKGIKEILERKKDIKVYILTFDEEKEIEINGKKIPVLKTWKWLLESFKRFF
ncbi:ATP-binding protein [Sulfurisphaera javensis]|uniref:ATP-binding protein n=1 Tax=Sulfurisphaera javensis TaxID=2049879 RepID=A0AAT9GSJ6_9CREN